MPDKLLLADDSVTIQRVIELTFADEDVTVAVVGDGRQAIERILSDPPDIVLADVGMPERDGYEVAAFLKSDPRFAAIPVVLLTGAFEPLDEDRARAVGCAGVLVKPFEPQVVINRVKELLSGRRSAAAGIPGSGPAVRERAIEDAGAGAAPTTVAAEATKAGGDALEDYFDRLDAAFANIGAPRGIDRNPGPHEDLSGAIAELPQPPAATQLASREPLNTWDPELTTDEGAARPDLATAFAALLAAEEGHGPEPSFVVAPPLALPDEVIEDIVQRVIARLSDAAVRQTVVDVAERLVRQEIDRIKHEARGAPAPHPGR